MFNILDRDWVLWEDDHSDSDQPATELKSGIASDSDEVFTQTGKQGTSKRARTAEHRKVDKLFVFSFMSQ